jgi:hypothetical protein
LKTGRQRTAAAAFPLHKSFSNLKEDEVYMYAALRRKCGSMALVAALTATMFSGTAGFSVETIKAASAKEVKASDAADTVYKTRFLQLYAQLKSPANGYFSPEGIPYHSVETLMSEAPDYGHMTTSEAYSYWFWLETLYGHYTGDWTRLEAAWDNMEKYILPSAKEQPTISYYNPNSPANYAAEYPQPDQYPSALSGKYATGKDPLDSELKAAYGNNQTYLMHWLVDVDNWYGFGNPLNPTHTATYVNTFQRGEQESVWEAVTHPSQDNQTFGKTGEGFMSLFTKESNAPSKQWRYTNATDADARAVQIMYWAKELGYSNTVYLDKAKKMGDYLRYGMYDKYFQKIGSAANGTPAAGTGKDASHYLMAWYTAWGGGLGDNGSGNWAWRIGASHNHQAYQNPVAAYALSQPEGGLIPKSATGQQDWNTSLKRQLEFYTWLLTSEGAVGGGATNSWNGDYNKYPAGVSTFYNMAYHEAPVYADPPSNNWFGFQAWSLERVAELYYILASNGDTTSENFKMAKTVISRWVDWALDYTFVNKKPVTDSSGYYLDASGSRILGGANPAVATVSAPGQFYIPSNQEWIGQPDTWNGYSSFTGNPNYHIVTKNPGQDVGVMGSYAKALTFYAAGTKAEAGDYTSLGNLAKTTAEGLLDVAWNFNDGKGIALPEPREDYYRYFTKEIYFPSGWTGKYGQGNTIPGAGAVASDPAKGGNGVYISYSELRPKIKDDPQWANLVSLYNSSFNPVTKKWENGTPTYTYHRFWSQVDVATAYAEYDRLIGSANQTPTVPAAPAGLAAAAGDAKVTLSWNTVPTATGYSVKRGATAAGPFTAVAAGLATPAYTDAAVVNGTTYYYVVSATNAVGEGPNSAVVSAKPVAGAVVPGPFTLTAAADTSKITLGWTASANAAAYDVKRGTAAAGPFTALAAGLTATAYTDTTAVAGTTYYYVVTAVNAAGGTDSNVASAKVETGTGTPGNLVVQYKAADTNAGDNQMRPHFQILNKGTTPVDLSGLKLRYYYTIDGEKGQTFNCDYAVVGSSKLAGSLVKLPAAKTGADYYLEVSFSSTAGTLAAGSSTGEMQLRINKNDWTNYNEADDYSFDAAKTGFADWNKVTLYQDGALVWGVEP